MDNNLFQLEEAFKQSTQLSGGTPIFAMESIVKGDPKDKGKFQEHMNAVQDFAAKIAVDKDIAPYLEGVEEGFLKTQMAVQMNNWKKATQHIGSLYQESTVSTSIANYNRFAFDLIRAILPEMASERLFSVQSMFGPTSQVFYFDYLYGTTTGRVTAGSKLFENLDPRYGESDVDFEVIGTGAGAAQVTGNLDYTPILPGTLTITDGTQVVSDDGAGNLVGDVNGGGNNTINYATGAFDVTFTNAVTTGTAVEASYTIDSEGNEAGIPEIDLVLTSSPVIARSKKLRTRFSLEAQFSLRATMGLEAEAEAVTAMGAEIAYGLDTVNVDNVKRVALDKRLDTDFQFDRTPDAGVSFKDHKEELVDYFIKGSSYILSQSGRAIGNKILAGENVTNICESLVPRFQPVAIRAARGIHFLGVLDGRWEVFKDLRMDIDEFMILFKGDEFLFAGYVFAPWILAFTTPTTVLDDMQARKGMGSLFGQKIINNKYYLRMKIIKS
jgi:hypothetical protein